MRGGTGETRAVGHGWGRESRCRGCQGTHVAVVVRLGVRETHVAHLEVAPHHLRRVEVDRAERRREPARGRVWGRSGCGLLADREVWRSSRPRDALIPQCALRESSGARYDCDGVGFGGRGRPREGHAPLGLKPQKICDMVRAGHPLRAPFGVEITHTSAFGPAESPRHEHPRAPPPPRPRSFSTACPRTTSSPISRTGSVTREERSAGTFKCTDWETGRELHRKYKTRYVYLRERDVEGEEGVACAVTYSSRSSDPMRGIARAPRSNTSTRGGISRSATSSFVMRKETLRWGEPAEWRRRPGWTTEAPGVFVVRATPSRTSSTQRARAFRSSSVRFESPRSRLVARPLRPGPPPSELRPPRAP